MKATCIARIALVLLLPTLLLAPLSAQGDSGALIPVSAWLTTADGRALLQPQPGLVFTPDSGYNTTTITVDETQVYQEMDGVGAALTDSSAWLISATLTASQRDALMASLFSPVNGIGLNVLRQPMGASDFAVTGNYSYDDMPPGQTDPSLSHFSISHDQAYIIPLLRQARLLNPALKIIGAPWSAPGWMKTTGSMVGGALLPQASEPWAQYVVKYVQAYQALGLPIYAVTPQNEPNFLPLWSPGMTLTMSDEDNLVKGSLAPAFASANLATKILVFDASWDQLSYPAMLLGDTALRPTVAGTAFHCYAGSPTAQTLLHDAYPTADIYQTECSRGGFVPTDFAGALKFDMHNLIIGATRNWSRSVIKWNIALDQNHGPTNGGCFNCGGLVTINHTATTPATISYNEDYYALGHISKFVKPGAYRIGSTTFGSSGIEDVAFRNIDGSKVLIAFNGSPVTSLFKVRWGTGSFSYILPSGAAATFVWSGVPNLTTMSAFNRIGAAFDTASSGTATEWCQDGGGGIDVSAASNGAYLVYNAVNFGAGATSVQARVASPAGGAIELHLDSLTGPLAGTLLISATGGAQSWVTVTAPVTGTSGVHSLYVVITGSDARFASLNWMTFDRSAFAPIPAASYDGMYGIQAEPTTDTGGGLDVGYTDNNDYLLFKAVDFGRGVSTVAARLATASVGGTIEFHLDSTLGPLIATVPVATTEGWQRWVTSSAPAAGAAGVHDLYIVFRGAVSGIANLNWTAFS